jgi:flagellar biosynthesis protein FlhF
MNMRTFQAGSMAEALALVKRQLGPQAVILHTRTFKRGGWFGFRARPIVEITAATDVNVVPRRRNAAGDHHDAARHPSVNASNLVRRAYGQNVGQAPTPSTGEAGQAGAATMERTAATSARAETDASMVGNHLSRPPAAADHLDGRAAAPPPMASAPDPQLADELRQLRRLVHKAIGPSCLVGRPKMPEKLFEKYLALLNCEVAEELAEEVIAEVDQHMDSDLEDDEKVSEALRKVVADFIPAAPSQIPPHRKDGDRPHVIALIGPTGVGKTTTVAKLAATFKLRDKLDVALVTIDTYRIAAVEQLKTYAQIIGLPLHVANSPTELKRAIADCAQHDVVLIDTAGRSQRDDGRLEELQQFIAAAAPDEVHLVLSGAAHQQVLMEAVQRFDRIPTERIIFTKLDETVSFGVVLNVMRKVNKKLSFITTGQEVPHQIECGQSEKLAGLILGERAL